MDQWRCFSLPQNWRLGSTDRRLNIDCEWRCTTCQYICNSNVARWCTVRSTWVNTDRKLTLLSLISRRSVDADIGRSWWSWRTPFHSVSFCLFTRRFRRDAEIIIQEMINRSIPWLPCKSQQFFSGNKTWWFHNVHPTQETLFDWRSPLLLCFLFHTRRPSDVRMSLADLLE